MGTSTCTFCSVKMFRSGAYKDKNGEIVRVDYIHDIDRYCKEHCKSYNNKIKN